jgi:hypothetical protein
MAKEVTLYKRTEERCNKCKYYETYSSCCGYILFTGKSRVFGKDGKMFYDGAKNCSKYEPRPKNLREREHIL